jgi:hypothetical protein
LHAVQLPIFATNRRLLDLFELKNEHKQDCIQLFKKYQTPANYRALILFLNTLSYSEVYNETQQYYADVAEIAAAQFILYQKNKDSNPTLANQYLVKAAKNSIPFLPAVALYIEKTEISRLTSLGMKLSKWAPVTSNPFASVIEAAITHHGDNIENIPSLTGIIAQAAIANKIDAEENINLLHLLQKKCPQNTPESRQVSAALNTKLEARNPVTQLVDLIVNNDGVEMSIKNPQ